MQTKYDKCKKKGYPTRKIAKKCMDTLILRGRKTLQNVYFCDICDCWHLTSMDKKKSRSITNKNV